MNILYINNVMNVGGIEKCIIMLSKELKKNHKIYVASNGGPLVNELDLLGIEHFMIENTDSKNIKTIIRNLIILEKIIREKNIDIVHSHHRMTTLYVKLLSFWGKFKVIHTQHLCIEDKYYTTKLTLSNLPIITVSNGAKKSLVDHYKLKDKNISTIYNTVDTKCSNNYHPLLVKFNSNKKFVIAHVSRLVDYKGVYDFLEIANRLVSQKYDFMFVIFGDGPEKENMIQYIQNHNLEDNVFLLGNNSDIISQLKMIDLLLLCSYIEGLPLVPLEAFSQGVPVIGTDIGGTNEEIIDGVNGYLVNVKDIDRFIDKILELYNDSELFNKMKENAMTTFNDKFTSDKYIMGHMDYYEYVSRL